MPGVLTLHKSRQHLSSPVNHPQKQQSSIVKLESQKGQLITPSKFLNFLVWSTMSSMKPWAQYKHTFLKNSHPSQEHELLNLIRETEWSLLGPRQLSPFPDSLVPVTRELKVLNWILGYWRQDLNDIDSKWGPQLFYFSQWKMEMFKIHQKI